MKEMRSQHGDAACALEERRQAEKAALTRLEADLAEMGHQLQTAVAQEDYAGAAQVQAEMKEARAEMKEMRSQDGVAACALEELQRPAWQLSKAELRDNAVHISDERWRLVLDSGDVVPEGIRSIHGEHMTWHEVQTNGNGACGLHAVFGVPSDQRELEHWDARGLARELLGTPFALLRQQLGAQSEILTTVEAKIWEDFVLPDLEEEDVNRLTREVRIFATLFRGASYKDVRDKALRRRAENVQSGQAKDCAKEVLYVQLREIFTLALGEQVWSPLATQRGLLPGGMQGFLRAGEDQQQAWLATVEGKWEYLSYWSGSAAGSAASASASVGAACKYKVLFDPNASYDGLRYTFLCQLCGDADLHNLPAMMLEDFDRLVSALSSADSQRLSMAAFEHIPAYTEVGVTTGPGTIGPQVWPCFVDSICADGFFLSIDELLLLGTLANRSVAIFRHRFGRLAYQGSTLCERNIPTALVSLRTGISTSTRGHFQRLLSHASIAAHRRVLEEERRAEGGQRSAIAPGSQASEPFQQCSVVTINVDGLGQSDYALSAGARMAEILDHVLASSPDVLAMQEVLQEMYVVLRHRLQGWSIICPQGHNFDYFNVTAVRHAPDCGDDQDTIRSFGLKSEQGRHIVTVRRQGWTIVNVHAESGGGKDEVKARGRQLGLLSRYHEQTDGEVFVLVGDFNVRAGEDERLRQEGWQDVFEGEQAWTWKRGATEARYDRVFFNSAGDQEVEVISKKLLRDCWGNLTDHVAVCVVLRMRARVAAEAPALLLGNSLRQSEETSASSLALEASAWIKSLDAVYHSGEDVRVIAMSNAAALFKQRLPACLQEQPNDTELLESDKITKWKDLPPHHEGGFKRDQIGGRGKRTRATEADKSEQTNHYDRYRKWAAACGVNGQEWRKHLKNASQLEQHQRGRQGIPPIMRQGNCVGDAHLTILEHAVLECRVAGLKKAWLVMGTEIDGKAATEKHENDKKEKHGAAAELWKLLSELTTEDLRTECAALQGGCATGSKQGSSSTDTKRAGKGGGEELLAKWLEHWAHQAAATRSGGAAGAERCSELLALSKAGLRELAKEVPAHFQLDGVSVDKAALGEEDAHKLRRAHSSIETAWWIWTWEAACREVARRYGAARPRYASKCETMLDVYKVLFAETPKEPSAFKRRNDIVDDMYYALPPAARAEGPQGKVFRKHQGPGARAEAGFQATRAQLDSMWDMEAAAVPRSNRTTAVALPEFPDFDVEDNLPGVGQVVQAADLGDGWYQWSKSGVKRDLLKYRVQASSAEDAHALLTARYQETRQAEKRAHALAAQEAQRRHEAAARCQGSAHRITLSQPQNKEVFYGKLWRNGDTHTFEQDYTGLQVSAVLGKSENAAAAKRDVEADLHKAMRKLQGQKKRQAGKEALRKAVEQSMPRDVGEMAVKGETRQGKLTYSWQGTTVDVTPRRRDRKSQLRETTPERALRKMRAALKRRIQRRTAPPITARAKAAPAGPDLKASEFDARTAVPAYRMLEDPHALGLARGALQFLDSMRLHHCKNCDEEWPVFGAEWPQSGANCAGVKAGTCETIMRAGYEQSWRNPLLCKNCAGSSAYAAMYSEDNLQHLGPRYPALSNLTWYESLLIARVHPVMSVITLTATGLLCYAGHVCNYYVKVGCHQEEC